MAKAGRGDVRRREMGDIGAVITDRSTSRGKTHESVFFLHHSIKK
jgi:hypothetical protein